MIGHEIKYFGSSFIVGNTSSKILGVLNSENDKNTIFRNVGNYTVSGTVIFETSETIHQATQGHIPYDLRTQSYGQLQSMRQYSFAR